MRRGPQQLLLFCLLSILAFPLLGQSRFQEGYIITNNFDSIPGYISYRSEVQNARKCVFKIHPDSSAIDFYPEDLISYKFNDGKYYVSHYFQVENAVKKVFLEYIVKGYRSLYYYKEAGIQNYYIKKDDGEMLKLTYDKKVIDVGGKEVLLDNNAYKGIINAAFFDCNEVRKDLPEVKLTHTSLIEITTRYNDYMCPGKTCEVYTKKVKNPETHYIAGTGYKFCWFRNTNPEFIDQMILSNTGLLLGAGILRTLPDLNENLSLSFNVDLGQYYFYNYTNVISDTSTNNKYYHFRSWYSEFSLDLRHDLQFIDLNPFIEYGPSVLVNFKKDSYMTNESVYDKSVITTESPGIGLPSLFAGINLNVGIILKLREENHLLFQVRSSVMIGIKGVTEYSLYSISLQSAWIF